VSAAAAITRRAFGRWEALLVVLILAAGVWSWTLSSFFLRRANLLDLATPYIFIGLAAFGLTFVVVAGEIDISVMSIMAVSAVSIAEIWSAGVNVWLAALAGLGVAVALGLTNGLLVGLLDLPSLAVTIGTLAVYRGIATILLGPNTVANFPVTYTNLGVNAFPFTGNDLTYSAAIFIVLALVFGIVLHATPFGRSVYAMGASVEAAQFSGIRVKRIKFWLFVLSGFLAGFAGILWTLKFSSARYDSGVGLELYVVTIVLLGGISIFGGRGTIAGVVLAVAVYRLLGPVIEQPFRGRADLAELATITVRRCVPFLGR
jgi:rhamnose transport system permease protein